jgi:chromosome segregation ATPase
MGAAMSGVHTTALFAQAGAAKTASAAMKEFFISMGPLGWAIIGVTALLTLTMTLTSLTDKGSKSQRKFGDSLRNVNEELAGRRDVIYNVADAQAASTATLETSVATLGEYQKTLEEAEGGQVLYLTSLERSKIKMEDMINTQESFKDAVYSIMIQQREAIDMTEEQVKTLTILVTTFEDVNEGLTDYMSTIVKNNNEVVQAQAAVDSWTDALDESNLIIESHEARLENLQYEYPKLSEKIHEAEMSVASWSDYLAKNNTEMSVHNANMDWWNDQIDDTTRAFWEASEGVTEWSKSLNSANLHIDQGKDDVKEYNNAIKENRYEIALAEQANKSISDSFDGERQRVAELGEGIQRLTDSVKRLSEAQNFNNIKIRKIRLQARKEGRDLTEDELNDIEQMSIANEDAAIKQMEINARANREKAWQAQQQLELDQKIQEALADGVLEIETLKNANKSMAMEIQKIGIEMISLEEQKNHAIAAGNDALRHHLFENHADIQALITDTTIAMEELEDDTLKWTVVYEKENDILQGKQLEFNNLLRDTEEAIWKIVFAAKAANALTIEPSLKLAEEALGGAEAKAAEGLDVLGTEEYKEWQQWVALAGATTIEDLKKKTGWGKLGKRGEKMLEDFQSAYDDWMAGTKNDISMLSWLYDHGLESMWVTLQGIRERERGFKPIESANEETEMASGGIVDRHGGVTARIGEAGPEAVIPLGKNQPYDGSMGRTRGDMAGGSGTTNIDMTVNINIKEIADMEDPAKLRELVKKMKLALDKEMRR